MAMTMPSEGRSSDAPSDRCGYTVRYFEREFWASDVCCWRESWLDHEHCFWHAKTNGKTSNDIPTDSQDRLERLDGAYLPNISIEEFPLTEESTLNSANLRGIQAPNTDLSNWVLNGANLFEVDLRDSNLCRSELRTADLSNANLEGADLSGAHLRQAQIANTEFSEVNATVCSAPGAKFHGSELKGTDFTSAYLEEVIFRGGNIDDAIFTSAQMQDCDFESASVQESDFCYSVLSDSIFTDCNLSRTDFSHADLSSTDFTDCSATEAEFTDIDGLNCDFQSTSVPYSDFSEAYLRHSGFKNATAINTDFSGSEASHADFSHASLDEATFRNSQLRHATFQDSTLCRANFEDVDLRGGNLDNTSLVGTVFEDVLLDEDSNIGEIKEDSPEDAVTVYRKIIRLLKENSLDYLIPEYRIKERKMKEKELYKNSQYLSGFTYTLLGLTSSYGERPRRVIISSGITILIFAAVFSVLGRVSELSIQALDGYLTNYFSEMIGQALGGLYFSVSSFVGLKPSSQSSLVHFLSVWTTLAGTLLMALLIFSLGRIATR